MDAAIFKVRTQTKKDVQSNVEGLALSKNDGGSYTHEDAQVFQNEVRAILAKQFYNANDGSNGMENLLANPDTAANGLTGMRSSATATRQVILAKSRAVATAASTANNVVTPDIDTNPDAQDEADRQNMFLLAVMGAKEGVAAGVATIVGKAITDPVLRTADSTTLKHVDQFHLHELMKVVIEGADRPATGDVRGKYGSIVATNFDFRSKMVTCVELLNANIEKMGTYGIKMPEPIVVMIILANVEEAAKWSPEHRIALTAIRARYPYEHPHDAVSMRYVLSQLAVADESRDRRGAPTPTANAAAVSNADEQLDALGNLLNEYAEDDTVDGDANAAIEDGWISASEGRGRSKSRKHTSRRRSFSPDSSRSPSTSRTRSPSPPKHRWRRDRDRDRRRSSRHGGRDRSRGRGRGQSRHSDSDDEPNDCKHCKAVDPPRRNCPLGNGPGSKSKCLWNPAYKGWHPDWICGRMGIVFKKKSKFSKALGGTKDE